MAQDDEIKKILGKYSAKLTNQVGDIENQVQEDQDGGEAFTREYNIFREEALSATLNFYERGCNFAAGLLKVSPPEAEREKLEGAIKTAKLNITPDSAYAFALMTTAIFILVGLFIIGFTYLLSVTGLIKTQVVFGALFIILGVIFLKPASKYPVYLAARWRLQASNQMVLCILYIVIYMRHTSNLEHAIRFSSSHIGMPLSLDLRKVLWDVETRKYSTIKEALDIYLEGWKHYNLEFVESFHLIESSLYETKDERRIELLEKSLEIILEGTYEKMLHYAQDIKSPITTMYMLGVILPILGLIILPLIGSFMGAKWYHLSFIYNLALPVVVYFIGYNILSKRPVGYAQSGILEESERYKNFRLLPIKSGEGVKYVDPKPIAIFIALAFILVATIPFLLHFIDPSFDVNLGKLGNLLDYKTTESGVVGPFGMGIALLSLLVPLGIAVGAGFYYKIRTNKLMGIRDRTKNLEAEFRTALFQMGNRIGGGVPTEAAFGSVAETLKGTATGDFLRLVDHNIRQLGLSINQAIFDEKIGALISYPSSLIESSMRVLVESSTKGPQVVSKALLSISIYLDRINKVSERLKDLLSEIVSSMKAQISFLTPMIGGIVVGIGAMITAIISKLGTELGELSGGEGASQFGNMGQLVNMFPMEKMISPFFFQIVVGLYVVEIAYVLTVISNGIENGIDNLNEENSLGKNLYRSTVFYVIVSGVAIVIFSFLAAMIASKGG
ncbi:MAG: hypothetical protein V1914_04415 [archaeon]